MYSGRLLLIYEININNFWFLNRETKIVLKGETTQQLMELCAKANSIEIPNYLVHDAGKTQVLTRAPPTDAIYALQMFIDNDSHTNALNSFI